jgi:hypothetical protein
MMKTAQLISPTLLARRIMYKFGKRSVFTNNYEKCRTVKCYRNQSANDLNLANELYIFLRDAGCSGHTVGWTKFAIIVRIPK